MIGAALEGNSELKHLCFGVVIHLSASYVGAWGSKDAWSLEDYELSNGGTFEILFFKLVGD